MKYYLHGIDQTICHPLIVGSQVLGRCPDVAICIDDPSISSKHGEIELRADGCVMVRDLGSTNGTFLGTEKITEVSVVLGQELCFGNVRLKLDDEPVNVYVPAPEVPEQAMPSSMPDGEPACLLHPGVNAVHRCKKCGHALCDHCVRRLGLKGRTRVFCMNCSGPCRPINLNRGRSRKEGRYRQLLVKVREFFRD